MWTNYRSIWLQLVAQRSRQSITGSLHLMVTPNCLGTGTTFTNQSTISSGSIASYNWSFETHILLVLGSECESYLCVRWILLQQPWNLTSNAGCTASVAQSVQVYPLPVASSSANTVCRLNQTTFTNTSSISSGRITNWSWNFGDNGTQGSVTHTYLCDHKFYTTTLIVTSGSWLSGYSFWTVFLSMVFLTPPLRFLMFAPNRLAQFSNASTTKYRDHGRVSMEFGDGNVSNS